MPNLTSDIYGRQVSPDGYAAEVRRSELVNEPTVASYTASASGQVFADSRTVSRVDVRASSSGVVKIRSGGSTGTVVWGEAAGGAVVAGTPIMLDNEKFASGLYVEIVSGTCTLRFIAKPSV